MLLYIDSISINLQKYFHYIRVYKLLQIDLIISISFFSRDVNGKDE